MSQQAKLEALHESKIKKRFRTWLSALFGDQKNEENQPFKQSIKKIPIANISRNKFQPRLIFDELKLDELASSIKKNGVIQPIAVRKIKKKPKIMKLLQVKEDGLQLRGQAFMKFL